ncbi:Hsp20/alpha crystallin family protein [bacterium]|nr:Hsp20/alpha crystallin family protein [bacterium]
MKNMYYYHPLEMMERILGNDLKIIENLDYRVSEQEDAFEALFKMPGYKQNEILAEVSDNILTLQAKSDTNPWSSEISKKFKLPDSVQGQKTEAKLQDGILHLRIPKRKESLTKKIEIL